MSFTVCSREYKIMLDHSLFEDRKQAVASFWPEVCRAAERVGVDSKGDFNETKRREVTFLDTTNGSIALNGFVLRQRVDLEDDVTDFTLKYRSPDRYLAAGADVEPVGASNKAVKLEEDIGTPFVSRFSRSGRTKGSKDAVGTLGQAAAFFPVLSRIERDGVMCPARLGLQAVNSMRAFERVLKGPSFYFLNVKAEVALILWSEGEKRRALVAEFSFRYGNEQEKYPFEVARSAMRLFHELQRLDWFKPEGKTKTEYAYRVD